MKYKIILIVFAVSAVFFCMSCERESYKNNNPPVRGCQQKGNNSMKHANTSKDVVTLKNEVELDSIKTLLLKRDTAYEKAMKTLKDSCASYNARVKTCEYSYANKYFYIIAIMAGLGLIAFLYVCYTVFPFFRDETDNIRISKLETELENVKKRIGSLQQHPLEKSDNTAAEIDTLKKEIHSIGKRLDSYYCSTQQPQQPKHSVVTDTTTKQIREGYVDDVKGNGDIGYFAELNPTQSNDSCYHIFNIKDNRAEFQAIDFKSVNGHNAAAKAVAFSGAERKDATNIESQIPGVVEKGKDGYWEILTKAQIKLM